MAPPPADDAKIAEATKLAKTEPAKAESIYKEVLATSPGSNQAALQNYENALVGLGVLYRDHSRSEDLAQLVKTSRSTLSSFAKAKTAKLGMSNPTTLPSMLMMVISSSTPRLHCRDPKHPRAPGRDNQVLYRLGQFRKEIIPAPEPRNKIGWALHAETIIL
jgi:hypothetical protein